MSGVKQAGKSGEIGDCAARPILVVISEPRRQHWWREGNPGAPVGSLAFAVFTLLLKVLPLPEFRSFWKQHGEGRGGRGRRERGRHHSSLQLNRSRLCPPTLAPPYLARFCFQTRWLVRGEGDQRGSRCGQDAVVPRAKRWTKAARAPSTDDSTSS